MTEKLRVYVAGPMESVGGNYNIPLFDYTAERLRQAGCEVYNPADTARAAIGSIEKIMAMNKEELKAECRKMFREEVIWICDHANKMLMLPGWEQSKGATAERAVALYLGIEVQEAQTVIVPSD